MAYAIDERTQVNILGTCTYLNFINITVPADFTSFSRIILPGFPYSLSVNNKVIALTSVIMIEVIFTRLGGAYFYTLYLKDAKSAPFNFYYFKTLRQL
jgi:hypothetical protein